MFTDPKHPYAQALISSLPNLENKGIFRGIPGLAPSLLRLPAGCPFHPRCVEWIRGTCERHEPVLQPVDGEGDRAVSCFLHHPPPAPAPGPVGARAGA